MGLMSDLLETYDLAFNNGLVDDPRSGKGGLTILPIFHSSRSSTGEDIFEITIDEKGRAVGGRFLEKGEIIIFPITEGSITRSGTKAAPHTISDELSYLANSIDPKKNEIYISSIREFLEYNTINEGYENLKIIGKYILKNEILEDFLKLFLGEKKYSIDKEFNLSYEEADSKDKVKLKKLALEKIFITFKLDKGHSGNISLTIDKTLHNIYIEYVREMNARAEKLSVCDITGELAYCAENHRGLLGTAKLIGVSNHKETYYGRFKEGSDIYRVSYESSQKAHNMLKFLLESKDHAKFLGEGAYLVNWMSYDINKGSLNFFSLGTKAESTDNITEELDDPEILDYMDSIDETDSETTDVLGSDLSDKLKGYFSGEGGDISSVNDFHILIIEKISNGRLSVKYHRKLSRSEAYERVLNWYKTTDWRVYKIQRSPSVYEIINFVYGEENKNKYLSCENKKLFRSTVERLIPCIIDGQKLPQDIAKTAFYRLSNKMAYKHCWDRAVFAGCSLIKKQKNDYKNVYLDPDNLSEVNELKESRSFCYGRLMAIYERIETVAMEKKEDESDKKEDQKSKRITNADKLWSAMIRTPERTRFILEGRLLKPYLNILKKNKLRVFVYFDRLLTEISNELLKMAEIDGEKLGSLNEDYILGYHYQKNEFFRGKNKGIMVAVNADSGINSDES